MADLITLSLTLGQERILIAFVGGLLPALFWLFFWLREDDCKHLHNAAAFCEPEPKPLLVFTFVAGMIAVPIALLVQTLTGSMFAGTKLLIIWAIIEESLKFLAYQFVNYKSQFQNEATDPALYLLTSALGFAAAENILYLFVSLSHYNDTVTLASQSLRFVGASLLHVVSSGLLGFALGLTFFKKWYVRLLSFIVGFGVAISLHTLFNYLIIVREGLDVLQVFSFVWVIGVALVLLFEKLKYLS